MLKTAHIIYAKNCFLLTIFLIICVQRTLSTIRTPNYIGEIICTDVNPGNIPPYIHGMRVLPTDLKEVVAMEIDIEYYGGAVLDIETRLEVQELENPESLGTNSDPKAVDEVTTDLLESFEHFGEQLKLNEQKNQTVEQKGDEIRKLGKRLFVSNLMSLMGPTDYSVSYI